MTFDEAINIETFYTLGVIYGGIAKNYEGLTSTQKQVFVDWMHDYLNANPHKAESVWSEDFSHLEEIKNAYLLYGHESPLAFPLAVSLCDVTYYLSTGEMDAKFHSYIINDIETVILNIKDITMDNKVYVYSADDFRKFNRLSRLKTKKQLNFDKLPLMFPFDSVTDHAAMLGIDLKLDSVLSPILALNEENGMGRVTNAAEVQALSLAEIMVQL